MSKLVYLLGAGASFGERFERMALESNIGFGMGGDLEKLLYQKAANTPLRGCIKRGMPVVNELEDIIARLLDGQNNTVLDSNRFSTFLDKCKPYLDWLRECCHNYPTIDTYAKQLFVVEGISGETYVKLKKTLSLLFSLLQSHQTRDLRYDAFLASIIGSDGILSKDISVLSWNYDCQFEFAYSNFMHEKEKNLNNIWRKLHAISKTYGPEVENSLNIRNEFTFTKINGSALIYVAQNGFLDFFFDPRNRECLPDAFPNYFMGDNFYLKNCLSFAWEDNSLPFLKQRIQKVSEDTSVVVVIGYSFPYVNREIDRFIFEQMPNLSKVYVQDNNADDVIDSVKSVLSDYQHANHVEIEPVNNVRQFYIPREL